MTVGSGETFTTWGGGGVWVGVVAGGVGLVVAGCADVSTRITGVGRFEIVVVGRTGGAAIVAV